MRLSVLLILFIAFSSCGKQYRFTSTQHAKEDTSYVYALPYPKGKSYLMVQGYNSGFSHRGRLNLDFKMKKGTPVTAARSGVVVSLKEDATKGGTNSKFFRQANFVSIRHIDGSQAYYGHLQYNGVLVNIGDTVQQGQLIAKSGSTGYSAFPHLHFVVWHRRPNQQGGAQLPTRFKTKKGAVYLNPGRWYRSI